MFLAVTALR